MPKAGSPPNDRSSRTLARWNEIESLTSDLAVQALQDLGRDSEQYMAEVKAVTASKQKLRELIIKVGQEVSQAVPKSQRPVPLRELETLLEELKSRLDSMNEMWEESSLRLQMMMDRRSKFISTLSNIMKKISAAQDTLVQNLK
jgi:phenylalanyl-tRNA synthetase alpha subunit